MFTFNGHDFDTLFIVGDPNISLYRPTPNYIDVSGKNGRAVNGVELKGSSVSFGLVVSGNAYERRNKLSTLGQWLDVDEPKPLVLPDTPDRYYLAVPDGAIDVKRAFGDEYTRIKFTITETVAYGELRTFTVPSGGSVTIEIGGNCATKPTITANATRNSSAQIWGVRLDEGEYAHIPIAVSSAQQVFIDCDNRISTVGGTATLITPDSDWLTLEPGQHTLRMDYGTGAATVTYRERWW